jgi:hypothetical protein
MEAENRNHDHEQEKMRLKGQLQQTLQMSKSSFVYHTLKCCHRTTQKITRQ